jgi:hypothetical protein
MPLLGRLPKSWSSVVGAPYISSQQALKALRLSRSIQSAADRLRSPGNRVSYSCFVDAVAADVANSLKDMALKEIDEYELYFDYDVITGALNGAGHRNLS